MRLAPFSVDLTPPIGFPLAYGFNQKVDSPIHLRGIVLDDGRRRTVVAAAELIGFQTRAYEQWRLAVALATHTPVRRVLLHAVHQHDSLRPVSPQVLKWAGTQPDNFPGEAAGWATLLAKVQREIARQTGKRSGNWHPVASVGSAERRLSGLAANRRILGPDGKVRTSRFSMTTRADLKREPIGVIDPMLRSVGFFDPRGELIATLHFYACHPMAAYGRAMASADVPGVALAQLSKALNGQGTHIYLTGCGADISLGKYTLANKERNLELLGGRLGAGLIANTQALRPQPAGPWKLSYAPLHLPLDKRRHTLAIHRRALAKAQGYHQAVFAAGFIEIVKDWKRFQTIELARLDLAPEIHLLSLPAETPIEFQLHVQAKAPDRFLACAAYGDITPWYICTPKMFEQGGYEPTMSICTGAVGERYYRALDSLLADLV